MTPAKPARRMILTLWAVAGLLACRDTPKLSALTEDDYAVMSAVIRETVNREPYAGTPRGDEPQRPIERVVIVGQPEPHAPPSIASDVPDGHVADSTTLADYAAKATAGRAFERSFRDIGTYHVVPYDSVTAILTGGFARFYEIFPGAAGLFSFSRVGFDRSRTEAIVFVLHLRGGTWGHEDVFLLRKRGERWVVVGERRVVDI